MTIFVRPARPEPLFQVRVNSLRMVSKAAIGRLKEGEEEKRKRYTALCVTAVKVEDAVLRGLDNHRDLVLQQVTCTRRGWMLRFR